MPIYEYACTECEHKLEVLQKMNDLPLEQCPACGQSTLKKLISAAAFHLKGTGLYETDFKGTKKPEKSDEKEKNDASPKKEKANTSPAPTGGSDASSSTDN